MGFPSSPHIQKFVAGQTIKGLTVEGDLCMLEFESGEMLRFYAHIRTNRENNAILMKNDIIMTPFAKNGEVKQSTEIMGD